MAAASPVVLPDIPAHVLAELQTLPEAEALELLRPYVSAGITPAAADDLADQFLPREDEHCSQRFLASYRSVPWPMGTRIPDFPTFVASPDFLGETQAALTPHQVRCIRDSIGLHFTDWMVRRRSVSCLWLCWGKGSGKDLISARMLAYVAYCIGKMRNPWATLGAVFGEVLDCINVAQDARAAADNFYARFVRFVKQPCFADLLNQKDARSGGSIAADRTEFRRVIEGLEHPVAVLRVHSLHSKNEAAEGKNTLFWVMDEADALRDADGDDAARLMFRTLRTSNRFDWRQLGIVISYPRSDNGFTFWGLRQCGNQGGKTPEWWGDKAPTWQVLPWKSYEPTVWRGTHYAPDALMAQLHRDDPTDFWATYGVRPPAVEDAFIDIPEKIEQATSASKMMLLQPCARVEQVVTARTTSDGSLREFVALALSNYRFRPGIKYFLGGDAGLNHDSFAICIAYAIPRGERGFLCPRCWGMPERRYAKHYRAVSVPVLWPAGDYGQYASPSDWRCDWDGKDGYEHPLPDRNTHRFWGLVDAPGGSEVRQKVARIDQDGKPLDLSMEEGTVGVENVWLPQVVEALLLEWRPDRRRSLTVDFLNVRDVILEIARAMREQGAALAYARFDKWQAETIMQELLQAGIPCVGKGMSNPQQLAFYRVFKSALYNNLVLLQPDHEEYPQHARARDQLRNLIRANNRIDHPKGGAKDLTDAEGIAFQLAVDQHATQGNIYVGDDVEGRIYLEQAGRQMIHEERPENERKGYSIVGQALDALSSGGLG